MVLEIFGGVGSGKSMVLSYLRENRGAEIIGMDETAHELYRPGKKGHAAVLELLGDDVLAPDGSLDRKAMADILYRDPPLLERLNAVIHPLVYRETEDRARAFLEKRIAVEPFFGDLSIMKYMIWDIYKLRQFNAADMSLYDLYHVLRLPCRVTFACHGAKHEVESVLSGAGMTIRYEGEVFASVDDFFELACADGQLLTSIYNELSDFTMRAALPGSFHS